MMMIIWIFIDGRESKCERRRRRKWWGCGGFHLLAIPPPFLCWLVFIFFYWHRPSRVNRIESVKETDAFSTERQREAEGKGVVTHLSWPSPLWATFPSPPSGPDVWKWNCFNFLTARTKSSRVSEEGKISLWKRQEKNEVAFYSFSLPTIWCERVCLPVSLQDLAITFFSSASCVRLRHGVISYIIIGSGYYHLECPGPVNRVSLPIFHNAASPFLGIRIFWWPAVCVPSRMEVFVQRESKSQKASWNLISRFNRLWD